MAASSSALQEIEQAIARLTPEELAELYCWLDKHHAQTIDAQLSSDLNAGRLDKAIFRALEDEASGRIRPL